MEEYGLLGIDRIRVLLGNFWRVTYAAARAGRVRRYSSSQVISDSVSRSETCRSVLFSELKFRVRIVRIAQKNAPIIFGPVNFIHFFCQAETGEPAHSTFFLDFDWLNLSHCMHIPIGQVKSDGSGAALAKE